MSTVTTNPTTERVNPNEFSAAFGKPLATVFAEAINDHGVTYRRMDSTHLRLFCGDRSVMPFKASRSRPVEETMPSLLRWLSRNVPTWDTRNIKPETLEVLRDTINGTQEESSMTTTTASPPTEAWVPVETSSGNSWGFETNGTTYRCTHPGCGYTQDVPRGLHLHYARHTGESDRMHAQAGEVRRAKNEAKRQQAEKEKMLLTQAITVIAAAHGYGLTTGDAKGVESLTKELDAVKAELIKVTNERNEARTRLTLIQEAMKA